MSYSINYQVSSSRYHTVTKSRRLSVSLSHSRHSPTLDSLDSAQCCAARARLTTAAGRGRGPARAAAGCTQSRGHTPPSAHRLTHGYMAYSRAAIAAVRQHRSSRLATQTNHARPPDPLPKVGSHQAIFSGSTPSIPAYGTTRQRQPNGSPTAPPSYAVSQDQSAHCFPLSPPRTTCPRLPLSQPARHCLPERV